jgi:hypothetical protein
MRAALSGPSAAGNDRLEIASIRTAGERGTTAKTASCWRRRSLCSSDLEREDFVTVEEPGTLAGERAGDSFALCRQRRSFPADETCAALGICWERRNRFGVGRVALGGTGDRKIATGLLEMWWVPLVHSVTVASRKPL